MIFGIFIHVENHFSVLFAHVNFGLKTYGSFCKYNHFSISTSREQLRKKKNKRKIFNAFGIEQKQIEKHKKKNES